MSKNILIIIPARNEAENISKIILSIKKSYSGFKTNILVIDDGSTDTTGEKAKLLDTFILRHEKSVGVSVSLLRGFNWGINRGFEYFVVIDGDGQHLPSHIAKIARYFQKDFDLITFSRFSAKSVATNEHPTIEKIVINTMLSSFVNKVAGGSFTDVMCGFFGITKNALLKLNLSKDRGYGLTLEIIIKAKFLNLKIVHLSHPCIYFANYPSKFSDYYQTQNTLGPRLASYVETICSVLDELEDHERFIAA